MKKKRRLVGSMCAASLLAVTFTPTIAFAAPTQGVQIDSVTAISSDNIDTKIELLNEAADGTWDKGDIAEFRIIFTQKTDLAQRGLQIAETNLDNATACMSQNAKANVPQECFSATDKQKRKVTHTINDTDVAAGVFKPYAIVKMFDSSGYKGALSEIATVGELPNADQLESALLLTNPKADGTPWYEGETMQFKLTLKNTSGTARSFQSFTSNMSNWAACKWTKIESDEVKECPNARHTVTAADVARGSYTPNVTWQIYSTTGYPTNSWEVGPTIYGAPVPVATNALEVTSFALADDQSKDLNEGDTLKFTLTFRNVGAQAITSVTAAEGSNVTLDESCSGEVSANGEKTCTVSYTVTKNDACTGNVNAKIALKAMAGTTPVGNAEKSASAEISKNCPAATPAKSSDADPALAAKDPQLTMVRGTDPTGNIRIPAITIAPNGDILAAYDYRPKNSTIGARNNRAGGDSPNENSIRQRRSTDGGKTWEPETVVAAGKIGSHGYSDPSYVVDSETGTIFNFHVYSQDAGLFHGAQTNYVLKDDGTVADNRNTINLGLSVSKDNGYNWEERVITSEVLGSLLQKGHKIIGCFATSGAGTQKKTEPHQGRLLQQAACVIDSNGNNVTDNGVDDVVAITIYSDNHGETWQAGNPTDPYYLGKTNDERLRFDENKVVELSNGDLMLNSRTATWNGNKRRIVAISKDGGETWVDHKVDTTLVDPGNNAQIIRAFPNAKLGTLRSKVLLFSNTDDVSNRVNGTLRISYDDGTTWDTKKTFRTAGTGYTTMAIQPDGSIGILMEPDGGGWNNIGYMNTTLAWLDPALKSELKAKEDIPTQEGTDGVPVSIPLSLLFDRNDPLLSDSLELTGLPDGFALNTATGAIEGTPTVGNDTEQTFNVTVKLTEEEDGTGRPRVATSSFALKLAPAPEPELQLATPVDPVFVNPAAGDPADCETQPYVTVTAAEGVIYTVKAGEQELRANADGHYVYNYGQEVTVTASAADGYKFAADTEAEWSNTAEKGKCPPANPADLGNPADPNTGNESDNTGSDNTESDNTGNIDAPSTSGESEKQNENEPNQAETAPVPTLDSDTDGTSANTANAQRTADTGSTGIAMLILAALLAVVGGAGIRFARKS